MFFARSSMWLLISIQVFASSNLYFDDAVALYENEQYEAAYQAFQKLAKENPHNGFFFYRSGSSAFQLERYADAIKHYREAIELGERVGLLSYFVARCYALLDQPEQSMYWLDRAGAAKLANLEMYVQDDEGFNSIREAPAFLARFPNEKMIAETPRESRWVLDLAYLDKRFRQSHYDLFRHQSEGDWEQRLTSLSTAIPTLSDKEVLARIIQVVASVGDGHSFVFPIEGALASRWLPLMLYQFGDHYYVLRAGPGYEALAAGRLTRIGKVSIEEAVARMRPMVSVDNEMGYAWLLPRFLLMADYLNALGITDNSDAVEVEVLAQNGQSRRAVVKTVERASMPKHPLILDEGWTDARREDVPKPRWQRHPEKNAWMETLTGTGLHYVQFNAVAHPKDSRIETFADALVEAVNGNDAIKGLILDCRNNPGGNNFLLKSMIQAINRCPKVNKQGHLFIIIGRNTFSAAQNFVNRMSYFGDPIFVGEPTGSKPNFIGETNQIRLPYSGLIVSASSRKWQDSVSEDARPWVAPHIAAPPTIQSYVDGVDPALEAILAYWRHRQDQSSNSP